MGRFYRSGFHAKFTDQVYMQTLLVLFTGLAYLLSFVLLFKPSLQIEFTNHVVQVKGFSQIYESSLWVVIMVHILRGQILCRFYKWFFRFEFILEFNGEMYALCLWFKFMEYVYGASLWVLFRHTFYEVVFYVDFRGCVFGFSFQSNIWIDYTWCVYGYILWDRFTGGVCDSSVEVEFTDQVY